MSRLDFFYFIGSTYTYLTVTRIEAVAAKAGVEVNWRPFDVRSIMIEQDNVPFRGKPVKMRYMWRDLERRAARHGIAFAGIPPYPVDADGLASRVATVAATQGWCEDYTRATYRAWFESHHAPGDPDRIAEIVRGLGRDPAEVVALANASDSHDRYAAQTETARGLGIFGSPTFVVGEEIFWGDDRLEEAVDWLASRRA